MKIKILMLGDVVGKAGVDYLVSGGRLRREAGGLGADLVIVNGENSAEGNGIMPASASALFEAGADVITGGNHTFKKKNIYSMLDDEERLLRPANYSGSAPGHGYCIADVNGYRIMVLNLAGQVFADAPTSPFEALDRVLKNEEGRYDAVIVDIHGEATSEKMALARYAGGRVTVVAGTHTHVQTADASVLPGGTGFITDLGMCGSHAGVLGVCTEAILHKFTVGTPVMFEPAVGEEYATGAIFEIDVTTSGAVCLSAEAVKF